MNDTMHASATVRPLRADDKAVWRKHWQAYLDFYKTELPEAASGELFERLLVGAPHFAFVAEHDDEVIGFVHALPHASTWSASGYCYLEDLFVDPAARGAGAGRALINAVRDEARKRGLDRVYWHTDKANAQARKLYDKVATLSDFVQYRCS